MSSDDITEAEVGGNCEIFTTVGPVTTFCFIAVDEEHHGSTSENDSNSNASCRAN